MPTPQWRIDFAKEFVLAQRDLESCFTHAQIQHQLKAAGIELKKYLRGDSAVYSVVHDGEEHQLRNVKDLVQYLG